MYYAMWHSYIWWPLTKFSKIQKRSFHSSFIFRISNSKFNEHFNSFWSYTRFPCEYLRCMYGVSVLFSCTRVSYHKMGIASDFTTNTNIYKFMKWIHKFNSSRMCCRMISREFSCTLHTQCMSKKTHWDACIFLRISE